MGAFLVYQPSGFCFRLTVPRDLMGLVGVREIRYSLHTHQQQEASRTARKLAKKLHELFFRIRDGGGDMAELSGKEIRELIRRWVRSVLRIDERLRVIGQKPKDMEMLNLHLECLKEGKENFRQRLILNKYDGVVAHDADRVLEQEGISLERESLSYKTLCREMIKAFLLCFEVDWRRSQGDYSMAGLPFANLLPRPGNGKSGKPSIQDGHSSEPEPQGEVVSQVVERLAAEKIKTGEWTAKTEADYRAAFHLFTQIVGDVPVKKIDRKTIDGYKQTLMKLPPNLSKLPKCQGKTIPEILAMAFNRTMAPDTVNRNLARVNVLFNYAEIHGLVDRNPATGLQLKNKKRDDELRDVFTPGDLRKLFHSRLYLKDEHTQSYTFWVPVFGLFTGARIEEICQLHLDDIRQEDGVWVLDINAKDEKHLKNPGSARLIPIHPFLMDDLRIIQYAESLQEKGEKRLFPELRRLRDGYSQRVSKWFNDRYKKACGITEEGKVFHSFRHTFINALKQNRKVDAYLISELVGHSVQSITMSRYGKRYEPKKLRDAIKTVKFDVNLSHLARSRFAGGG
jgi:integrase